MIVFVRDLVVKDLWLKLFSLALAVLIWLTVQFSISKEVSPWAALIGKTADESIVYVPVLTTDGRAVALDPPQVQVTLRGDPQLLRTIGPENVRAQVNLSGVEIAAGLRRPVEIVLPQGISYSRLIPNEVEVRVAAKNP